MYIIIFDLLFQFCTTHSNLFTMSILSLVFLDLIHATKASNHNVIDVKVLEYLFNLREWISPHLEKIKYHTEPHIFCFAKNQKGKSVMYYKAWSCDNWQPSNDGHILLKVATQYSNFACAWKNYNLTS